MITAEKFTLKNVLLNPVGHKIIANYIEFGARKIFNVCIPDLNFLDMFIRYGVQHSVILQVKNLVYAVHMLNST